MVDWQQWYAETLDGLINTIESATVPWATQTDGTPWVVRGQRRPRGIEYPHAMVLEFTKTRAGDSQRANENLDITARIDVFRQGDTTEPEELLDRTLDDVGAIENALYGDKSLGGTCDTLVVTRSTAFELETASGHETVGDIELTISKRAHTDSR